MGRGRGGHVSWKGISLSIFVGASRRGYFLPRHSQVIVDIFAVEELLGSLCQFLLHSLVKNDFVPARFLDLLVELLVLVPVPIIDPDDLKNHISKASEWKESRTYAVQQPPSHSSNQVIRLAAGS